MRRALVIGLSDYQDASVPSLRAAQDDADRLALLLRRNYDHAKNFDCIRGHKPEEVKKTGLRTEDGRLSGSQLIHLVDWLFQSEAEMALLYFAGHGVRSVDGGGAFLCNAAQDDLVPMETILKLAMASTNVKNIVILIDTCYSGSFALTVDDEVRLRDGIAVLTASLPGQVAAEYPSGSVFSSAVGDALEGAAADILGEVTIAGIYSYLDQILGAWDQRPMLRASVSQLYPVRKCQPVVTTAVLAEVFQLFPHADKEFPLDPSYEPDERYGGSDLVDAVTRVEHMRTFAMLQKCRAAALVEPIGYDHMFDAAVKSGACRLTLSGKRWWKMFGPDA